MLSYIKIKDYILIKNFEGNIKEGFTTVIGETGAGKSMLLSAINLACGKRIDFDTEKSIKDQADISIGFDISDNEEVKNILSDKDIYFEDCCILRRTIKKDGKNKAFINGIPVTLKDLMYVSSFLIDIYTQDSARGILSEENQIKSFDDYLGLTSEIFLIEKYSKRYQEIKDKIKKLQDQEKEGAEKFQLLSYKNAEFDELDLGEDEYVKLFKEFDLISNSKEYQENALSAFEMLSNDEVGILTTIGQINRKLSHLNDEKESVKDIKRSVLDLHSIAQDLERDLERESESYEFDQEEYFRIENRLSEITSVAKKNNVSEEELFDYIEKIRAEFKNYEDSDFSIEEYEVELGDIKDKWFEVAKVVSQTRKEHTESFQSEMKNILEELKMGEAEIKINFMDCSYEINKYGLEKPCMKIKTNLGQDFEGLKETLSGGEASRFSLAIQSLLKEKNKTIIFDEIDTGIGGITANNVGRYMKRISKYNPVISISHIPQVVLHSDQQFIVKKNPRNSEKTTSVIIEEVRESNFIYEMARMMGYDIVDKNVKEQIIKIRKENMLNE